MKAHARNTDPETSREAAGSVEGLREKQKAVLRILKGYRELCDERLLLAYRMSGFQESCPQSDSGLRTRRAELVRKGLIMDSGLRVKTLSGRNSIVWRLA